MTELRKKVGLAVLAALGIAIAIELARSRPGMFANAAYLRALIFIQVALFALSKFRQVFFVFLMAAFMAAGLDLSMRGPLTSGRWLILAVGAIAGFVVFMRQPQHRFGVFHFVAGVGVLGSLVSAMVSDAPAVSGLKALSLGLLFVYAACGGRAGILGREQQFVSRLVLGCEVAVYATAACYCVLGQQIWGNPNSLGIVMALLAPVLLWAWVTTRSRAARARLFLAFVLSATLLVWSNSRAGIFSSAVAMLVLCVSLRQNRLIVQGVAVAVCLVSVFAILAPGKLKNFASESTETLVYKGHHEGGILASRKSPWQDTMDSVHQHPWFGTGFGTSATEEAMSGSRGTYVYSGEASREHGSSYLAILEWVGVVGCVPFYLMILLLGRRVLQTVRWLYRNGNATHPAVPLALVLLTGLLHAGFEDWLFAVGYYATVFFWTLGFSFIDIGPVLASTERQAAPAWINSRAPAVPLGAASSHQ
jgi:O-antigen ligase